MAPVRPAQTCDEVIMNFHKLSVLLCVSFLASACAWVKPTERGANVKLAEPTEVSQCRKVGTTTVSVMDKIAGVPRSYLTISEELATLARNEAPNLDGDTVVPAGEIVNGQQVFDVYDCHPDEGGAMTLPYPPQ